MRITEKNKKKENKNKKRKKRKKRKNTIKKKKKKRNTKNKYRPSIKIILSPGSKYSRKKTRLWSASKTQLGNIAISIRTL